MPAISLKDLHQQIAQRECELQALRQELGSRQNQLSELTQRKEKLQNQLQQVEEDIAVLTATAPVPTKRTKPAVPVVSSAHVPAASTGGRPKLRELIVAALRDAAGPMTARRLCEEAQRRGYQPTSQNPIESVKARLQDLRSQGVVRRASGQPGYILAPSADGARRGKSKPTQPAHMSTHKAAANTAKAEAATEKSSVKGSSPSSAAAKTAKPGSRVGQPPLSVVLRDILKNSRKTMSASELAERARAAGYRSNSPNFLDIVRLRLAQMDKVEHMPEKGYRLKRN